MRVTRETLIRLAKETAQEKAFNDKSIIAAYLTGSLLTEEPFLGGVTDIDLVYVTSGKPPRTREIVKLTNDFHLDIFYRSKADYNPPRALRTNPWLGYEIYDPILLFESQHFLEFTQAAVRAGFEFHEPALVLQRCRKLLDQGRRIWFGLTEVDEDAGPIQVGLYLEALYQAANAVAELHSPPLPDRRLLLRFPGLAEQAGRPGMSAGLVGLLGGPGLDGATLEAWLPDWASMFLSAAESGRADLRIHSARLAYYQRCFEAMLGSDYPLALLWPLIRTWTLSTIVLPETKARPWFTACERLGLLGTTFLEKVQGLDHFLDEIEILLDEIAEANGLETSTSL